MRPVFHLLGSLVRKSSMPSLNSLWQWLFSIGLILAFTGPFLLLFFNNSSPEFKTTEIIRHPVELIKDVIKDITYAIVVDGGSTGSRIHVFAFVINPNAKQRRITLEKEYFFYTSPGLSSYYKNTSKAALSLDPLLHKALDIVPEILVPETKIIVKATAGLRLLPSELAQEILEKVERRLISDLPFKVEPGAISMLTEKDEGLFAWYTVNFLLGKLHNINESIVALDLGGASTQITFSTYNLNTLIKSPKYIVQQNVEGEQEFIYTHSYLGNGLMAVRRSILLQTVTQNFSIDCTESNCFHITNPCFKILSNKTYVWKYSQDIFHIRYQNDLENSWEQCFKYIEAFLERSNIDKPEELPSRQIYAMSYFYDRMKDIKAVKNDSANVKVRDFFIYAEHICNGQVRMRKQSPFLCLDLSYIAAYLHLGLGIPLSKDITLVKKINGIETSWALGAAINIFEST